jgi:hypothetical protein
VGLQSLGEGSRDCLKVDYVEVGRFLMYGETLQFVILHVLTFSRNQLKLFLLKCLNAICDFHDCPDLHPDGRIVGVWRWNDTTSSARQDQLSRKQMFDV